MNNERRLNHSINFNVNCVICRADRIIFISPVVDTFQNQSNQLEAQQCDDEDHLVILELLDVGVESIAQQDAVLHDDDEIKQKLSDQGRYVLEWFGPGKQQRIHSII